MDLYSICAGKDLAAQTLFISLATILWAFNIENALDANGVAIIPPHGDMDFIDDGVVVCVRPPTWLKNAF